MSELYQILNEEGIENKQLLSKINLSNDKLLEMYRHMLITRILDGWLMKLQRMGKAAIHAPNEGQEAIAVGVAHAAEKEDWFFPTYRDLGLLVAKGAPIREILNRWLANAQDPLKGHEFAIYGGRKYNMVPTTTPVSVHLAAATGFAHAAKIKKDKLVVFAFLGDGATSKGDFHESLNWAGVFKLPIVYVCQNNQYAISMPFRRQTASETIAIKSVAYGIKGMRIDGNDILAVYSAIKEARESALNGMPVLVECLTYRLGSHTTADDPTRYRSQEEVEEMRKKEPIKRFRAFLISKGILSEKEDEQMRKDIEREIEEEVKIAITIPPPPVQAIFEDVYSELPWHLKEQMEELVKEYEEDHLS
ncbi:MAG: thiamine pyrophosphate-dependent dehydrogenase E1 component subunit alpha [Thermoproteota archaeon]|jgi:pyruvate dehydrogenase E1 component alpha subunit|nr:thiamine pyrophosphate-dependent dehydrogenase E1 component subunit alpha [Thermoproteota archaeon]